MSELKKKINYMVACVNEFADSINYLPKKLLVIYTTIRG